MDIISSKQMLKNSRQFIVLALLIFINSLFAFKYALRQSYVDSHLVVLLYATLLVGLTVFLQRTHLSKSVYTYTFYTLSALFFIFTVWLNNQVDGYLLNVDRWSAMEVGIRSVLENKYPYSAPDHLNQGTSNLPSLIFIGMPFYFLGDVGYLQSFSFLLYVLLLIYLFDDYKTRLIGLILLISSAAFGWEIYAKSDLLSNAILLVIFVSVVQWRHDKKYHNNPVLIALLSASLLLTRLTAIIPLCLLLLNKFIGYSKSKKTVFLLAGISTATVLLFLVFRHYQSIENFKLHNPFVLQNQQLPFILSLVLILIPAVYALRVHTLRELIQSCVVFLSLPIFLSFFLRLYEYGFYTSVVNSAFDISYFNFLLPFYIIFILLEYKNRVPEQSLKEKTPAKNFERTAQLIKG